MALKTFTSTKISIVNVCNRNLMSLCVVKAASDGFKEDSISKFDS